MKNKIRIICVRNVVVRSLCHKDVINTQTCVNFAQLLFEQITLLKTVITTSNILLKKMLQTHLIVNVVNVTIIIKFSFHPFLWGMLVLILFCPFVLFFRYRKVPDNRQNQIEGGSLHQRSFIMECYFVITCPINSMFLILMLICVDQSVWKSGYQHNAVLYFPIALAGLYCYCLYF